MRFSVAEDRWWKAQVKRRLLPAGKAPRRIRAGLLAGLTMQLDFAHQTQRWLGLQERELYPWMRRFAAGIQTAIDVGANDGMYTLYFLARTSARKIFSFDAAAESLGELRENLGLNGLGSDVRLEVVAQKVAAQPGDGSTTLDSFAASIGSPCLVKADIDGGEAEMLRGAQGLLRAPGVRWIIEVHSKALEQECLRILREANYQTRIVRNAWWRHLLPELRPGELNHWLVAYRS